MITLQYIAYLRRTNNFQFYWKWIRLIHLGLIETNNHWTRIPKYMSSILEYVCHFFYVKPLAYTHNIYYKQTWKDGDREDRNRVPDPAQYEFELIFSWIYKVPVCRYIIQYGHHPCCCLVVVHLVVSIYSYKLNWKLFFKNSLQFEILQTWQL